MVSSWIRFYKFGSFGGYSFADASGYGKVDVDLSNTNLSSQKVYCWIDDDDFVSYLIFSYVFTSHSNKERYSFLKGEGKFSAAGDGRGGVSPNTTDFYSQKVDFITDKHDDFCWPFTLSLHSIPFGVILE